MGLEKLVTGAGLGVAGLLLQGVFAQSASAQNCTTDDQCAAHTYCSFDAVDGGVAIAQPAPGCAPNTDCGATTTTQTVTGQCSALPPGMCETDSDCAADETCAKPTAVPSCPPVPAGTTSTCDTVPVESRYGTCSYAPMPCSTDADCATGLSCVVDSSGTTSSAGTGSTGSGTSTAVSGSASSSSVSKAAEMYCEFVPKSCASDADCPQNYQCADTGTQQDCAVAETVCPDGGPCSPPDTSCTQTTTLICMPRLIPCVTDAECPSGFVCFTWAVDGPTPPAAWNQTPPFQSCVPEGLVAYIGSVSSLDFGNSGGKGAGSSPTVAEDAAGSASNQQGEDLPKVEHGDGSMCAAGPHGRGQAWLAMLVSLLGVVLLRRRVRVA